MNKLIFQNLSIKYKNTKTIIANFNYEFNTDDFVAIIGKSGAGKTTIFNALTKQAIIEKGSIIFNNLNLLNKKNHKFFLSKMAYLSQEINLIENDNVYLAIKREFNNYQNWFLRIIGWLTFNERKNIFQTLDDLEILDKAYTRISELSQGQKQRVEIAKIFIKNPKIILADEPTSSLDIKTSKITIDLIKKFAKKNKAIVFINTHDLELLKENFNKVMGIKNNKIVFVKPPSNLKHDEIKDFFYNG